MADITEYEAEQVDKANATGKTPVVFIHGLWLLPSSWDRWRTVFEAAGYATLSPGWPDDPNTVDEANRHPEVFAHKTVGQVADHFEDVIAKLTKKPAIIGHSFGGLLTQILAGRGLVGRVGRDRPGAVPRRAPAADLGVEVGVAGARQSREPRPRGAAHATSSSGTRSPNAVTEDEAHGALQHVRGPGGRRAAVPGRDREPQPVDRGEGQLEEPRPRSAAHHLDGEKDHTVPPAIANASYKKQKRNKGVTEIKEIAGRGHSLTIDNGWREVADTALGFVQRFAKP